MRVARALTLAICISVASTGCSLKEYDPRKGFQLPAGDTVAGKAAFTKMSCNSCHAVKGDTHAKPIVQPPVPVRLGPRQAKQSREQLALSIIDPSHSIPEALVGAANVRLGTLSRMGSYREAMTVQELVDIVEYLRSLR